MSAEKLLGKLDKVKKTGRRQWQALCPAHNDRAPSLALKELDDGRLLVHCFAGCGTAEVLDSIGIRLADLFPKRKLSSHIAKKVYKPWSATDVLSALAVEVLIVWQCAKQLASGEPLQPVDQDRLLMAVIRLQRGHEVACYG